LPIIGCTRKIRKADRKTVAEYKTSKAAALSSVHLPLDDKSFSGRLQLQ